MTLEEFVMLALNRAAFWLAMVLLAVLVLSGIASQLGPEDLTEMVMRCNFGEEWRHKMEGSSRTNRVEFERMQAILSSIAPPETR
jgi:hypothetical protein